MDKKVENFLWLFAGIVVVIAAAGIILSMFFRGVYAGNSYAQFGMMGGYGYNGIGVFMPIIAVISVIFAMILIFLILGAFSNPQYSSTNSIEAIEIAKQRFARGEVSEEEYDRIIKTIGK
ncbi:MAG: SHOCT domain-containing protein [Thermoplasmataceae archaeon]